MAKATILTEAGVKRFPAPPLGERIDRPDRLAPGLFLRTNDKGRKSWMVHFRVEGKQGKFALGTWPAMKVGEARDLARWARDQARQGVHPRDARAAEEEEKRRAAGDMFGEVAEQYINAAKAGKLLGARKYPVTEATAKGRESRLRRLVLPTLKDRPLPQITAREISDILSRTENFGGPVDRTLQDIRLVYRFASARGLFEGVSPTLGLRNRQPSRKLSRTLNDDELHLIWRAADSYGYPFGPAVQLLILTGQRRDEIGDLKWDEVDFERRMLIVPQRRNKNRKGDHEVPLSDAAWAIIQQVQETQKLLSIKSEYLFTITGISPVSGWSKAGPRLDKYMRMELVALSPEERDTLFFKGQTAKQTRTEKQRISQKLAEAHLPHWRFHDIRHTVITRLRDGEQNIDGETTFAIPLDVIQQVVNHEITAGVTDTYDHGDIERRYRIRKREALEWWGRKLMNITRADAPEGQVVNLPNRLGESQISSVKSVSAKP